MTPWTAAPQAHLSMRFSRQGYWSGLPFPSPGDLPNPGIELGSPVLQADSLLTELQGKLSVFIMPFDTIGQKVNVTLKTKIVHLTYYASLSCPHVKVGWQWGQSFVSPPASWHTPCSSSLCPQPLRRQHPGLPHCLCHRKQAPQMVCSMNTSKYLASTPSNN